MFILQFRKSAILTHVRLGVLVRIQNMAMCASACLESVVRTALKVGLPAGKPLCLGHLYHIFRWVVWHVRMLCLDCNKKSKIISSVRVVLQYPYIFTFEDADYVFL